MVFEHDMRNILFSTEHHMTKDYVVTHTGQMLRIQKSKLEKPKVDVSNHDKTSIIIHMPSVLFVERIKKKKEWLLEKWFNNPSTWLLKIPCLNTHISY